MLTSCSLSAIPFLGHTDSTRLSMSSKQMAQALTCINSEIPYVISSDYRNLVYNSQLGIRIAEDDGKIIYKNSDIIIYIYDQLKRIEHNIISPTKKTHGNFASSLRNALSTDDIFQKGDVLYEYDCFHNGVPSFGFNTFAAFFPFFGYNHEDSLVISESFAAKSKATYIEKIYIPIYENAIIQKIYADVPGSLQYFPAIGQKIKRNVVYRCYLPKSGNHVKIGPSMKTQTLEFLKKLKVSGLLSMSSTTPSGFVTSDVKSKLDNAIVSGIKIHRLNKNTTLLDHELEATLKDLYNKYGKFAVDVYTDLQEKLNEEFAKNILKRYYVFADRDTIRNNTVDLKHAVFLLELELTKEEETSIGDKLANRYANKGVISLILPDELRPIPAKTNKPIDVIYNPFSIFSRMNLGQLLEGIVSKSVMSYDDMIKNQNLSQSELRDIITTLNKNVLEHLNNPEYCNRIQSEVIDRLNDKKFAAEFVENVRETNLFVEAPAFSEVDTRSLLKHAIHPNEDVHISEKTLKYVKDEIKLDIVNNGPIKLKDIFCAPIYTVKLYKIASHIISARDLGSTRAITKQPTKGRASGGGSKLGQMEITGLPLMVTLKITIPLIQGISFGTILSEASKNAT